MKCHVLMHSFHFKKIENLFEVYEKDKNSTRSEYSAIWSKKEKHLRPQIYEKETLVSKNKAKFMLCSKPETHEADAKIILNY